MKISRKLFAAALMQTIVCACGGGDSIAGPQGPAGPAGPQGAPALVDYEQIYGKVRAELPPLVQAEIAKNPLPAFDTTALVQTIVSKVPAGPAGPQGPKGDKGDPGTVTGGLALNAEGDLVLPASARLCWIQCMTGQGEQIQLLGNSSGILYVSNWDGTWYQSSARQYATAGLAPDGGWRVSQNQLWTRDGTHRPWINPKPQSTVGFDSQGMWSMLTRDVGDYGGGQDIVFDINHGNGTVDIKTWQPGVRLRLCQTPAGAPYTSATDCR